MCCGICRGWALARGATAAIVRGADFRDVGRDERERGRAKYFRMETGISAFIRNINVRL